MSNTSGKPDHSNAHAAGDSAPHLPTIAGDAASIARMHADPDVADLSHRLLRKTVQHRYSYNFTWWGRPVIQLPTDILAMQMLVLHLQPDVIVETGVAHGGMLVMYATLMQAIGKGRVVGVDIEIRPHNRQAIQNHPMAHRIKLIEGSSTSPGIVDQVRQEVHGAQRVLVCLDSNHTDQHVRDELALYAPLVTLGSYLIVFDTVIENIPEATTPDRPWSKGNSPMTAVKRFLAERDDFAVDRELERRIVMSYAPDGFLRRVK